ncbi:MAG: 6,7-dimethyl-8-ribityllumazine synthase, partial [Longimicrobiales bacterium]
MSTEGSPVDDRKGVAGGEGVRVVVIAARFNSEITEPLLSGAREALIEHGVRPEDVTEIRVPGAW